MSVLWGTLAVLLAIVWLVTVSDLVRRHLGRQRTIAWLLIVLILPFAGAILYWVLRKPEQSGGALQQPPSP
jgi:hypothetical protein